MKARFIRAAAAATFILAMALVPIPGAEASDTTAAVKDDARTAGHAVAHGATTVGHAVRDDSRKAGHAVADGARHLGQKVRDGFERLKATMSGKSGEPKG